MQTLQELSTETIRKNWITYKDIISKDNLMYELLWNDLYKKFEFEKNNEMKYVIIFRDFIEGKEILDINNIIKENDKTLIMKGLDGYDRKIIHKLCDKIGLHHNSITMKKRKRHLYIYLPENWCFEFTERNPYSKDDEYYLNLEKLHNEKIERHNIWLSNIECDGCSCNASENQMYRSVYIRNTYCSDCLETLSDGDGGNLNDHKFEPIY